MHEQTEWHAPITGGAPLLTMPNVPFPLQGLAPRTIMGMTAWNKLRKECYEAADNHCEICGVKCGTKRGEPNMRQAHEVYDYDFTTYTATFVRAVCLCRKCHTGFIHSGRALTCYKNHEPLWTQDAMLNGAEHGFQLIQKWNKLHPDEEPLRAYETFNDWLEEPSLEGRLAELMAKYQIEMWCAPNRKEWDNAWGKWKLIYDGTEYYSPYQTREDWSIAVEGKDHGEVNKQLFEGNEFEELRKNITNKKGVTE